MYNSAEKNLWGRAFIRSRQTGKAQGADAGRDCSLLMARRDSMKRKEGNKGRMSGSKAELVCKGGETNYLTS